MWACRIGDFRFISSSDEGDIYSFIDFFARLTICSQSSEYSLLNKEFQRVTWFSYHGAKSNFFLLILAAMYMHASRNDLILHFCNIICKETQIFWPNHAGGKYSWPLAGIMTIDNFLLFVEMFHDAVKLEFFKIKSISSTAHSKIFSCKFGSKRGRICSCVRNGYLDIPMSVFDLHLAARSTDDLDACFLAWLRHQLRTLYRPAPALRFPLGTGHWKLVLM